MKNFLKQFGKAVCYFLLFFGMQIGITVAFEMIYGVKVGVELAMTGQAYDVQAVTEGILAFIYENTTTIVAVSGCLTLLALWLFFRIRKKRLVSQAGIMPIPMGLAPLLIALGVTLELFVSFGMMFLPQGMLDAYEQEFQQVFGIVSIIGIFAQVIVAPIVEEVIFRGLILSRLRKAIPTAAAVIVSAFAFGLMHGQILWASYAFLLGVLFSAVAIRTKSVLSSIVLHMSFNAMGVLLLLVQTQVSMGVCAAIAAVSGISSCILFGLVMKKNQINTNEEAENGQNGDMRIQ